MPIFSPVLSSALNSIFSQWDLPVFTLPFNIAITLYLAATGHYNLFFPTTLVEPVSSVPNITWTEMEMPLVSYPMPVEWGPPAPTTHLLHNWFVDYPGSQLLQMHLHQMMVIVENRTGKGCCSFNNSSLKI